eukprot:5379246-Pleurochrysis_carterae.AAC.1
MEPAHSGAISILKRLATFVTRKGGGKGYVEKTTGGLLQAFCVYISQCRYDPEMSQLSAAEAEQQLTHNPTAAGSRGSCRSQIDSSGQGHEYGHTISPSGKGRSQPPVAVEAAGSCTAASNTSPIHSQLRMVVLAPAATLLPLAMCKSARRCRP